MTDPKQRKHALENLDKLVVKAVGESGGYGMLIGPQSTQEQRDDFKQRIEANPRNYIAQPTLDFSRAPCLMEGGIEPRHVDLRPYILFGDKVNIVPGGLTRVALRARLAGGEFLAGRRQQRHLGLERLTGLRRSSCSPASRTVCIG